MPKKSIFRQPGAQHFQLVHRSQRDPLIHDPDASQHVLKAFERENVRKGKTREDLESSLLPEELSAPRPNVGQASLYEIYYDDTEYDYMQHLRTVSNGDSQEEGVETIMLPAPSAASKQTKAKGKGKGRADPSTFLKSDLPDGVLPSTTEIERNYESGAAVPSSIAGFQPDMDLHLRQTLEALEDDAFVDDELQDDFFGELVKDGERDEWDDPEYDFDENGLDDDEAYIPRSPTSSSVRIPLDAGAALDDDWMARFAQYKREQAHKASSSDDEGEDEVGSEGRDTISGLPRLVVSGGKRRRKGASEASGYSLSSSSMFRNKGLSTLDEQFAKVEEDYASSEEDEDQDGDDSDGTETDHTSKDECAPDLLGPLLDEFLEKYELVGGKVREVLPGSSGAEKLDTLRRAMAGDHPEGAPVEAAVKEARIRAFLEEAKIREAKAEEDGSDDDDIPMPSIVGMGKNKDRWDVETILSTYTNLENHPRLIKARDAQQSPRPPRTKHIRIELDPKTGLPRVMSSDVNGAGKLETNADDGEPQERRKAAEGRAKDETAEDKRRRKHAVKEAQQARRVEKKTAKIAFSNEKTRQIKVLGVKQSQEGVRKL